MQVVMKRDVIRRKAIEPKSSADGEPDARDGGVQSVDRALSIIETLAEDDEGYRLSDLAIRTGLSTSTVHRLLGTLENRRFVQFDRTESKWHVGARCFTVGATFARRRNFSAQAVPYLRKLRDLTRETANLAVVDDEFIVVLTRMESREIVRPSDLFKELAKVRRQGYAVDDEEACMGLRCIAAVVYNDCSEPLAAISVSGMTSRLTDDRLATLGQTVREVAT